MYKIIERRTTYPLTTYDRAKLLDCGEVALEITGLGWNLKPFDAPFQMGYREQHITLTPTTSLYYPPANFTLGEGGNTEFTDVTSHT